jgi:hypothetical protein
VSFVQVDEGAGGVCVARAMWEVYVDYPLSFWVHVLRQLCLRVGAEVLRETKKLREKKITFDDMLMFPVA